MNYVHSTASQTMVYPIYAEGRQNQARILKYIRIKGCANVADPRTLATSTGVVTEINDEDLALLKRSAAFQRHVTKGFMKVYDNSQLNTEGMQARDGSAQLRDAEYADGTDTRVPGSGNCQAACGLNDQYLGKRGAAFRGEGY